MGIIDDIKYQFKRPNNLVLQLIIVNVIIWIPFTLLTVISALAQQTFFIDLLYENVSLPSNIDGFIYKPWTIVTYGFFHSPTQIFHIIMNMYIMYLFGNLIAGVYGQNRILSLYILGVIAGGILYLLAYNLLPYYMQRPQAVLIGASAGVTAIVVAAATFMPDYKFNLLFIGPIKIVYIAAFMVFMSYIGTTGNNAGGELSHLGGAIIGYFYAKAYRNGTDIGKWVISLFEFFKNIFKPKPKIKVSYSKKSSKTSSKKSSYSSQSTSKSISKPGSFTTQAEIDTILDKISQSGYESLTKEEKQKLFSASQKN